MCCSHANACRSCFVAQLKWVGNEEEGGKAFPGEREASKVLKLMLEADSDVNLKESMEFLPASWLRLVMV